MVKENEIKDKIALMIAAVIVFAGLFLFFAVAHPLYIYDTDDWTYIACSRHAWPSVGAWNPTKVLPETLMPIIAELGIRLIMPFKGDYIGSMAFSFAFFLSLTIMVYLLLFRKLLTDRYGIEMDISILFLFMFLFYHFLPFDISEMGNKHMFYAGNVTCIFNYLIPGLMNASMVMYLMLHPEIGSKNKMFNNGILFFFLFLCINSNMFHSVILIAFIGTRSFLAFISGISESKSRKKKTERCGDGFILGYVRQNFVDLIILMCWLVSIAMESQGGRAQRASGVSLFDLPLSEVIKNFIISLKEMRRLFVVSIFLMIVVSLGIYIYRLKKRRSDEIDRMFGYWFEREVICLCLTLVYLLLLCAKVSPSYIQNVSVMFSWMFWILMMGISSLAYIVHSFSVISLIIPLAVFTLICETVIDGKVYAENNVVPYIDIDTVKGLDENIIHQIIEAEKSGEDLVQVLVPVHSSEDWPIAVSYGGERISSTLLRHGIIHKKITVILVPDRSINDTFHLH